MGKLEGKVAAITGGTRSIGRAMAEAYLREGAKVVINGRDEAKGQQAVAEMGGGPNVVFYGGDASKQATAEGIVDFAVEKFGQVAKVRLLALGTLHGVGAAVHLDDDMRHSITPACSSAILHGCATSPHRSCLPQSSMCPQVHPPCCARDRAHVQGAPCRA